ncbi:MAG: hypothetical protein KGO82_12120 [Bacteroidota bacterium]|nr:hypothetical protein [Bacteroidota bacterium]
MPNFITRIELQSATQTDYQKLAEEMKKGHFSTPRKTARKKGNAAPLEFTRHGNYSLLEVTDAAVKAARKTGKPYSFTVIREKKLTTH